MSEIETIDPEIEPEYVGAHSALAAEQCQNYTVETKEDIERCDREATHTVVMFDGNKLSQIAMCDECGEPDDLPYLDREWAGELRPAKE